MTIDHPQQEAPVSVIGAASPDPSLLFGNNSDEFDSTLNSNCVLEYSDDLAREEIALRRALFLSVAGTRPMVLASEGSLLALFAGLTCSSRQYQTGVQLRPQLLKQGPLGVFQPQRQIELVGEQFPPSPNHPSNPERSWS